MTQRLKIFLLCTLYMILGTVKSQLNPINAQLTVAPPYSTSLLDYGTGNNIHLYINNRDINSLSDEFYLNIEVEGVGIRLKTLPSFRPNNYVYAPPMQTVMLGNSDLAEYLNVNSLSFEGMGRDAFLANGQVLPEGFYRLKVRCFSKMTGISASNEAMAIMVLERGQPPIINTPFDKGKVPENPMQNFNINWTVRNINPTSPPSYRLQMWEMLDPSQDPNIIANSNYPPILDEYTNFTTFQYGMSQTPLTAGKSYVIRVQVLDPEGRDVYANGGYSQVRKFTYGDPCEPPTGLKAVTDNRGIQANWDLAPNQGGYRFQHGRIDTAWSEEAVLINRFSIEKTYPSAQYQMRVATVCGVDKISNYSPIVTIGTSPSDNKNQCVCGGDPPKIDLTNKKLLQSLAVGDRFSSYDFDITVTRVFRNDSTSYAGEGKTPFYMLGGVDVVCYFDGITINTDRRVIKGEVRLQSKPYVFSDKNIKQFKEDFKETQERFTGDDASNPTSVNIDVTIGTVTYDSTKKEIVINDVSGSTVKVLTTGKDYKITDKDGNVYLVSKDNKISKQPKATESGVKGGNPVKDGGENYDIHFTEYQPILTFEAHPQQVWGFDAEPMNSMVKTFYETIINTQRAYYVPYKSVGSAGTDKVIAKVERNPENVDLKRIKFKTNAGVAVPFTYDATKEEWELTITAGLHRNDFSVFPYYTGNGKDTLCGKLNVMPLDKKEVNLVLVPLNGFRTSNVKATDIEAYLNKVYHQANIAYKVSLDYAFSSASADQPLSVEHGKLEGEYSVNQANVITDYQVQHPEQDNTIYLFLCKEGSNDAVKGHTPVNRSYGFIFGENTDKRTIAHEVGHGYPLALEHPFTTGGATGTYSNLMDYATGTNLSYLQWGGAHNPKLKVRFGQKSEDGQFMTPVVDIDKFMEWLRNSKGKTVAFAVKDHVNIQNLGQKLLDAVSASTLKFTNASNAKFAFVDLEPACCLLTGSNIRYDGNGFSISCTWNELGEVKYSLLINEDGKQDVAFRLSCASYGNFTKMLGYLGLSLQTNQLDFIKVKFTTALKNNVTNCKAYDKILYYMPDFVYNGATSNERFGWLSTLALCGGSQEFLKDNTYKIIATLRQEGLAYAQLKNSPKVVWALLDIFDMDDFDQFVDLITAVALEQFQPDYVSPHYQIYERLFNMDYMTTVNFLANDPIMQSPVVQATTYIDSESYRKALVLFNPMEVLTVYVDNKNSHYILTAAMLYRMYLDEKKDKVTKSFTRLVTVAGMNGSISMIRNASCWISRLVGYAELGKLGLDAVIKHEDINRELRAISETKWLAENWVIISMVADISTIGFENLAKFKAAIPKAKPIFKKYGQTSAVADLEKLEDDVDLKLRYGRPFAVFKHKCTSGIVIMSDAKDGTFIMGSFHEDLKYILVELGYKKFTTVDFNFPVPAGQKFNLLDVTDDVYNYYDKNGGFFPMVNGPWIDAAVKQKADILVASDVYKYENLFKDVLDDDILTYKLTGFGKEIHRLEWTHGYRYDPTSKSMVPPSKATGLKALTKSSDYNK